MFFGKSQETVALARGSLLIETYARFSSYYHTFVSGKPVCHHIFICGSILSECRISNTPNSLATFTTDFFDHNEVILIPVQDCR